ncbi:hypothetical protein [Conexibacter sp. SYSU D00693]|uniref:hypothetical protein n=1 Tax=Conexibacter sp. SYSU D00693 TaxID=2812560 RepID=UPI00196B1E14|nr:hypothetical protein [Conexibacter sp. SYSU D00693]
MDDIEVLQAVRLKGRATPEQVAGVTGADATQALAGLAQAGLLVDKGERYRMTPEGKARLGELLTRERAGVDQDALAALYEEFTALNATFKELATAWQQRDGAPNDHTDAAYDGAILRRLADEVHPPLRALLDRLVAVAPRLAPYPGRFDAALATIQAGDHAWFLRPVVDSYHTVWFELHEDLIGLAGHTREAEAAAGRAA